MPAFQEVFIDKQLLETEYRELITKGYLKIKMDLSVDHLKAFSTQYKMGDKITFQVPGKRNIHTFISSIDIGEPHDELSKVFIGLTLL